MLGQALRKLPTELATAARVSLLWLALPPTCAHTRNVHLCPGKTGLGCSWPHPVFTIAPVAPCPVLRGVEGEGLRKHEQSKTPPHSMGGLRNTIS